MHSQVRLLEPGVIYDVVRRTVDSQFLLLPDKEVNRLITFCVARAQQHCRVSLYAYCFMSNHVHMVMSAQTPDDFAEFQQRFAGTLARAINKHRGRHGPVWAQRYSAVPILDSPTVLERVAYILLNPVKAGLCFQAENSPMLSSAREMLTGKKTLFSYQKTITDSLGRKRTITKKTSIRLSVLPFFRNIPKREQRRRLRKALTSNRANQKPKKLQKLAASWRVCTKPTQRFLRKPRCFSGCKKRIKEYLQKRKTALLAYAQAVRLYCFTPTPISFPIGMFPPSRLPLSTNQQKRKLQLHPFPLQYSA